MKNLLLIIALVPFLLEGCVKEPAGPKPEPDPPVPEPWELISGNYWMHCIETDSNPDATITDDHGFGTLAVSAPNDSIVLILGNTLFLGNQADTTKLVYLWIEYAPSVHYRKAIFFLSNDSLSYVDGLSTHFTGHSKQYEGRKME